MEKTLPGKFIIAFTIFLFCTMQAGADIREDQLQQYKSAFRAKVLGDNPGREQDINRCLDGMIREGGAGVRLIDKFGLFLYDSSSNNLSLERVRFIRERSSSIFIIFLKDGADGQSYSLYLEYIFNAAKGTYALGDIFFAKVFDSRAISVREFFEGD